MTRDKLSQPRFEIIPVFGSVEIQTRFIPCGNDMVGQGRAIHKDGRGQITKITPWESTGVKLRGAYGTA